VAKPRRREEIACPQCGGTFPSGRLACPHCGSDAQTGWSEGDDFHEFAEEDYEEVVADLEGREVPQSREERLRRRVVVVTGLVLVALFLFWLLAAGSSFW
jgi:hypothetical protein